MPSLGVPGLATSPNSPDKRWIPVLSSNVKAIMYDPGNARYKVPVPPRLFVRFRDGAVYQYLNVPRDVWQDFLGADSKGRFVYYNLTPSFSYSRVAL